MSKQKAYIGSKIILAEPMNNFEFRRRKGQDVADFEKDQEGYMVEYPDGYTSWSPKAVFEEAYRPVGPSEGFMACYGIHPNRVEKDNEGAFNGFLEEE